MRRSHGRSAKYWSRGCNPHDSLSVIPNQRGSGRYSQPPANDSLPSDEDNPIASVGFIGHDPGRHKPSTDPVLDASDGAFREDDIDPEEDTRLPLGPVAPARIILIEADDSNGEINAGRTQTPQLSPQPSLPYHGSCPRPT